MCILKEMQLNTWILMVFFAYGTNNTVPVVIENIVSQAECQKLEELIHKEPLAPVIKSMCVPVRKSNARMV